LPAARRQMAQHSQPNATHLTHLAWMRRRNL